ncbi:hypothetical protein O6H91_23G003400 [Diphasiastrum complanatum]|uniref:Uncharacterized protein n=1 Tax=Diphasiastrum complanatum TaxID=34168 RepID=A0ACC2A7K4_DIPCM|nr:hypothetical protein O6H91_23G003400 [Diphasiastrum complanatum]
MERKCELCPARAALYCAADEAYVCWECDSNVHGANFLVARHYRSVLCRSCSSPTLWRASGARFHPTTCLCPPCQSGNLASGGSDKSSNENQTDSAAAPSAVSEIQNVGGWDTAAAKGPESRITVCSSSCQAKEKVATSSRCTKSNKIVKSSFNVRCSSESRPPSPVSVISSGRALAKKRRTLVLEEASIESSSDSDSEEFSSIIDSRDTEDPSQIDDSASTLMEPYFFSTFSRRRRSLIRLQNRTPDQDRRALNHQLTILDLRQLCNNSGARIETIFWDWHDNLNLRSPATVALAMRLVRRFCCAIKVSDIDRLDSRFFLAGCFWIAIKFHNPQGAEPRSWLYEQCTGIPLRVLLAAEARIYHLLNWRIDQESCTDGMPRWAMNDA